MIPYPQSQDSGQLPSWLDDLIEIANDWRYSDEFVGNVFRYYLQREENAS